MRLHRLVLGNYRGIAHREVVFPDNGVIVVSGANEVGKSSMIEALDLLLEAKDRSGKREVKQVKPTHADVGAEVTAEISTGAYRFVYSKRFHKKCRTELTMLAPRREQLTGDEAHERVRQMLAETVDTDLWRALRVLQAASTAAVDLSGCDALSRALDLAAGKAASSAFDGALIDRIDAEYTRYFTPTGRPTGEWGAAKSRLVAAEGEAARCAAAVAEVDETVRRHAELTERLSATAAARGAAAQRVAAARTAAESVAELTAELTRAGLAAEAAEAAQTAAAAALAQRVELIDDLQAREHAVAELDAAVVDAVEAESTAREVSDLAERAADRSQVTAQQAQVGVEQAGRVVDQVSLHEEAARLVSRLAKIDAAEQELARVAPELAAIRLTAAAMREIEVAAASVERAAAQLELASVRIELTATTDVALLVDGRSVTLAAGQQWASTVSTATDVEMPGVVAARVLPGAPVADSQDVLEAARHHLAELLDAGGVADIDEARTVDERRNELVSTRDRCAATLAGLCDEPVERSRSRLAELRERDIDNVDHPPDGAAARAELDAAVTQYRQAAAQADADRQVAAAAAAKVVKEETNATVWREKLAAARAELKTVARRLAEQRETYGDDEVASRAASAHDAASRASQWTAQVRARVAERGADTVAAELADALHRAEQLDREHAELTGEARDLSTALRVFGTEGRKGRLDAAQSEREHAANEYGRVGRRARAAELLREVMVRHRDNARLRYVEPFRDELERLGRLVFGETFEVEVDSDLRIVSRTVSGRTVPYGSLSGGAQEQLGIVARLAGAALVAKADTVPVIIDDALGFTDADRLARMGVVFDEVGGEGQVLVLTCSPHRFDSISGAHHIDLRA